MATKFKIGDVVQLVVVVPTGPVKRMRMIEETGEIEYLIPWVDGEGEDNERWFPESQLEFPG
jgi:hypothetical protein